jgi:hypothetical protein
MKVMRLGDYLKLLRPYSNSPVTLNRITLPFGILTNAIASDTLLMGHILEDLSQRLPLDQTIDAIDVAAAAYDLGHEPAGDFLDEAPYLMARSAKDEGVRQIH